MAHWISNFVVVMVTPLGLEHLNYRFYIVWAVTCASFVPIIYVLYPETARKSLEEIDIEFLERPGILRGLWREEARGDNAQRKKTPYVDPFEI